MYIEAKHCEQGHLHPKLEVPIPTVPAVGGENYRKEPFKQSTSLLF
jgi:hypothetical protein